MAVITITKQKFLTDAEYALVVKECNYRLDDVRAVFVLFVAYTGARRIEVSKVRKCDVSEDSVYIRGAKGSLDREIPLPKEIVEAFHKLEGDAPFGKSDATLDRWWNKFRPEHRKCGLHTLRHTMALRLYKKTKDIRLVKYLLGHKSITNTMVYADYCYSQDELREALL